MNDTTAPTWQERCIFTAALWNGAWWLDRVNPTGRTRAAVGPYRDEISALRAANDQNRWNQGWVSDE